MIYKDYNDMIITYIKTLNNQTICKFQLSFNKIEKYEI